MNEIASALSVRLDKRYVPLMVTRQPLRIGSGVVIGLLGESHCSLVYETRANGKSYAVKVLKPHRSKRDIQRLQTGARVQSSLSHASIIRVHTQASWNGLPFVEMDKAPGNFLSGIFERRGALPPEVCCAVGLLIVRVLKSLHAKGVAHGNLKPGNIGVTAQGSVYVTDVGAVLPGPVWLEKGEALFHLLRYHSPEQITGASPSASSDMFSLGCILYEAATGAPAFPGENGASLIRERLINRPAALNSFRHGLPRTVARVVQHCLEANPRNRPGSAAELESAFAASAGNPLDILRTFMLSKNTGRVGPEKKPFPYALVGTALVLSVGGYGAIKLIPWSPKAPSSVPMAQEPLPQSSPEKSPAVDTVHSAPPQDTPPRTDREESQRGDSLRRTRPEPRSKSPPQRNSQSDRVGQVLPDSILTLEYVGKLLEQGKPSQALRSLQSMPAHRASSPRAIMYRLRALAALNDRSGLESFFSQHELSDREFYLNKGRMLHETGRHAEALKALANARRCPVLLSDARNLDIGISYYTALCYTSLYKNRADEASRRQALDAWFDLKYEMRNNQRHRYYQEANKYIRELSVRIGETG